MEQHTRTRISKQPNRYTGKYCHSRHRHHHHPKCSQCGWFSLLLAPSLPSPTKVSGSKSTNQKLIKCEKSHLYISFGRTAFGPAAATVATVCLYLRICMYYRPEKTVIGGSTNG